MPRAEPAKGAALSAGSAYRRPLAPDLRVSWLTNDGGGHAEPAFVLEKACCFKRLSTLL
jgi:hypothetical protein